MSCGYQDKELSKDIGNIEMPCKRKLCQHKKKMWKSINFNKKSLHKKDL